MLRIANDNKLLDWWFVVVVVGIWTDVSVGRFCVGVDGFIVIDGVMNYGSIDVMIVDGGDCIKMGLEH